ncbi:hypothetical protein A5893_04215 [Pedobacter psychrophilus]|uniref:DUF2971 domain-containing protein n=1 Tax=Pedobacter psychrophilus TaxID=1826909 RepID=A0A179DNF7_9SPHI|nr:DUF2971 domain-containing protein [Pedobacter psychrophilus]OAQ42322.1 hypothetical protein A5893_04215 [Pedobacter psychrophilus]
MKNSWQEKYWKHIVADNIEEAIPLKLDNFPNLFYKFRNLTERVIDSINENYIWLAEISSLNDPFECSIQFDNDECLRLYYSSEKFQQLFASLTGQKLSSKEVKILSSVKKPFIEYANICKNRDIPFKQSPEEQLNKVQNRWNEIIQETNRNLRICSFSLNNHSLLLWSHYANEHKGISIEYDFLDLEDVRTFIQPVIYRNQVHKIGIFDEYNTMQMIASSLIKSEDWKYEQEWRLTIFKQKENFPQKLTITDPKAIYLGTRFYENEPQLQEKLFDIAKVKNIPVFQMEKHPNEFKLIQSKKHIS